MTAGFSMRDKSPDSSEPLLTVTNLVKKYGAMTAVNNLTFTARVGEVLGISGPNGAGKTTLFDVISGVARPTSGTVLFGAGDVTGRSAIDLCHLGMARTFQLNAVFDTMTVRENLETSAYFGRRNRLVPALRFDRASRERAEEIAGIVGLSQQLGSTAKSLTVLERKLLMLGSALAGDPKLLLLDEPVGGLNAKEIEYCAEILRRLRDAHGITIILIEHVMSFMTALSDRVLILHHGRKLYEGAASELVNNKEVVEVYLGTSGSRDITMSEAMGE